MIEIVDFHSHVLPGIDDGSNSVEQSIAMLQMEVEQGIQHVVATPHFYPKHHMPEDFLSRRAESESLLRTEMSKNESMPHVSVGAEIYFFSGIANSEVLQELTIDKKGCIILEMPPYPWTESMYKEMEDIVIKQGITPVIAHIDRYIRPFRTHGIPEQLAELPVLVQANASFFLKASTRRLALRLLREDKIHLIGSDCHNTSTRKPNMGLAIATIEKRLGAEALERIQAYQQMLLTEDAHS